MGFFIEVLVGGLMAGVLYSLVALGFVLIFKASGVFNFAQGAMVLFAALSFVRLLDILKDTFAPMLLALAATIAIMIVLAIAIERLVLRPLVNQPGISLFMATLGIAYFLDGFGQAIWGSDIYTLDVGMPKDPVLLFEVTVHAESLGGVVFRADPAELPEHEMLLIDSTTGAVLLTDRPDGKVIGIVTLHDLLRAQTQVAAAQSE